MNKTVEQATANIAPTASVDAIQPPRTARPRLPHISSACRAAMALASGLISLTLLGAVVLGLTSQPKQPTVADQKASKPAGKGAADAASSVAGNANPL